MDIQEMKRTLDNITYKDWDFWLGTKGETIYLQVQFKAPCADENNVPTMETQHGRKWWLSRHMTKSELVQTALKAVLTAEEHEVRERFKWCGEAVFGPHFHIADLWKLSAGDRVDVRDPKTSDVVEGVTKMTRELQDRIGDPPEKTQSKLRRQKRITDNRN